MTRAFYMLVAIGCYSAFFVSFVYLVGFLAGVPLLPMHVDKGIVAAPAVAAAWDIGLIALFGLQHSIMARKGFKAAWTRIVPEPIERSVYCLASALVLAALYAFWHPIPVSIWNVTNPVGRNLLWGLFLAGFGIVFISTWLLNHFELFGLAQVWRNWRGEAAAAPGFKTPLFYRLVRHPIYSGFFIAFWATPQMSAGHLLLAVGVTIYLFIGIHYEERDLIATFGKEYADYRKRVGTILPGIGKG
jgi:protein-S-isoprenylcysteine O-methyltransferase Ste14